MAIKVKGGKAPTRKVTPLRPPGEPKPTTVMTTAKAPKVKTIRRRVTFEGARSLESYVDDLHTVALICEDSGERIARVHTVTTRTRSLGFGQRTTGQRFRRVFYLEHTVKVVKVS